MTSRDLNLLQKLSQNVNSRTVAQQLTRFQLTGVVARSLYDVVGYAVNYCAHHSLHWKQTPSALMTRAVE